jgi:hypothetical protein
VGFEGGGDGDDVDLVGFLVFCDLDCAHFLRDRLGRHGDVCFDGSRCGLELCFEMKDCWVSRRMDVVLVGIERSEYRVCRVKRRCVFYGIYCI